MRRGTCRKWATLGVRGVGRRLPLPLTTLALEPRGNHRNPLSHNNLQDRGYLSYLSYLFTQYYTHGERGYIRGYPYTFTLRGVWVFKR